MFLLHFLIDGKNKWNFFQTFQFNVEIGGMDALVVFVPAGFEVSTS